MLMGKSPKSQLLSKLLLLVYVLVLVLLCLCFVFFQGFGLSPFLVSFPIMILSTLFLFKFTKKKQSHSNETNQKLSTQYNDEPNEQLCQQLETQKQAMALKIDHLEPISECFEENQVAQMTKNRLDSEALEQQDFPSESEVSISDTTSEDFEPKWDISSTNVGQNMAIFESYFSENDDSDSDDDDSLIEISLPGSESSGFDDDLRLNLPESIFNQKGFIELMADMNEEENLIEIDLSIGSIKCPRFEIKT